jgi:hypothetical protein
VALQIFTRTHAEMISVKFGSVLPAQPKINANIFALRKLLAFDSLSQFTFETLSHGIAEY